MELFGSMPDAVKFIVVFLVILGILVPLLWRRFSAGSSPLGIRGRQQRLAVIDTAAVDVRRKLVLVKRDSVEHLLLIGGPSDIVVESGIGRTPTVVREPRPIPDIAHPDVSRQAAASAAAAAPDWSLPLEPMPRPARTVDLGAALPEPPPARTAREAMVDSMRAVRSGAAARRNAPAELETPPEEVAMSAPPSPSAEVNYRPPAAPEPRRVALPEPLQPAPEPAPPSGNAPEPKRGRASPAGPRPASTAAAPAGGAVPPMPRPVQPMPPAAGNVPLRPVQPAAAPTGPVPPAARPASSDESNLAEMAQRLEAALRRPTKPETPPSPPPMRPPVRPEPPAGRRPPHFDAAGPGKAAAGPGKASTRLPDPPPADLKVMSGKGKTESAIESLEDEMAKMLGRPGKS